MPTTTIVTGVLLIVLGLVGFIGTGSTHYTSLIPAGFGIILGLCGFLAKEPERLKLFMHIAVTLGLVGFVMTVPGLVGAVHMAAGQAVDNPPAVLAKATMAFITGI